MERLHGLLHGASSKSRDICAAWAQADRQAVVTIEAWLRLVAGPLAVLVNATGAGVVPVAGGLGSNAGLGSALDAAVRQRMLRRTAAPVVVPSRFGDEAGLVGAALLLQEQPSIRMPS